MTEEHILSVARSFGDYEYTLIPDKGGVTFSEATILRVEASVDGV